LANQYSGLFKGCIGIGDVKGIAIEKSEDSVKEKAIVQLKKINWFHLFSVMDHSGRFFLQGFLWVVMIATATLQSLISTRE
jgi:hypothetical protein